MAILLLAAAAGLAWHVLDRPAPIVIAVAGSYSGPAASLGVETRTAMQIYLDRVNAASGVDGHPVVLQSFDDHSRPDLAKANVVGILDSPAVAVLGNTLSSTSVAAGPGYAAGHIPALTGMASADQITQE